MKSCCKIICIFIFAILITFSFFPVQSEALAYGDVLYLGGTPIGVVVDVDGVLVQELCNVLGRNGNVNPAENGGIRVGDYIYMINGYNVKKAEDISKAVELDFENSVVMIIRGDDKLTLNVKPEFDVIAGSYKLGLKVKDELAGVGTLTYVTTDTHRFGALGHQIFDAKSDVRNHFNIGNTFTCSINGIDKGQEGKPGELHGYFERNGACTGIIERNNFAGIFGTAEPILYDNRQLISKGNRFDVKPGVAYIYTTIDGNLPEKYEIEIVKAETQNEPKERSMVIHVTDDRLLEKTGGIVQGMSGSPIIQNGKLVGAVTHVFINDSTRGYGIFLDWMLEKGN